jgi:hypothetical protein
MPMAQRVESGGSHERNPTAVRLYELLDCLVAARMDFGHSSEGDVAALDLGPERIKGVRALLDHAIASTKDIIGTIERPPSPE